MVRIAICDDNQSDRQALKELICTIAGYRRKGDVCFWEYSDSRQLLYDLQDGRALDLLFLDIYLGGELGMDAARTIRSMGSTLAIVFLTSSPEFALQSYDVEAVGYLVKPPSKERVERILNRTFAPSKRPKLAVKCSGRRAFCEYDEILYLESSNNVTFIHLTDGQTLRCAERLNTLEQSLHDARFLRCHQSFLVNMDHIKSAGQDFILRDGSVVPIRVRSRRELTGAYYRYFVSNAVAALPEEESRYV